MIKRNIKVGIIGGSGLDDPTNQILNCRSEIKAEYAKNEFGTPTSSLYQGTIAGVHVVLLSRHGPGHKTAATAVNYRANIEALRLLGCTHVLASTACGSLSESISRGQLVIPDSFIDRTKLRKGTFFDNTSENYPGVCYIPMEPAFDPCTSNLLEMAAKKLDIPIKKGGTIVSVEGPRFSSKAESNMFRQWGGHLINMTTCPEVCLAKEAGLLYAAVAIVTDYDCWRDSEDIACARDILEVFKQNVSKVTQLLVQTVELIGQEKWENQLLALQKVRQSSSVSY